MTPNWTHLDLELARWTDQGLTLPLWWRDDDAIEPTAQLDRLTTLSERLNIPVHLAVIPKHTTPELAEFTARHTSLIPVVHGWAHQNHAPADQKKAEFGAHRPLADMIADITRARATLHDLFPTLRPMFVPPWNRIAPDLLADLPQSNLTMISTFTPRKAAQPVPNLTRINTHLDPIDWRGTRSLVPAQTLIDQITNQLADRRMGKTDNTEPYGILTHHLVHDDAIWSFTQELLTKLSQGPTQLWTAPKSGTPT